MEIRDFFEKRVSVRQYKPDFVSDKDIERILCAASLAPTARNIQPWEFIVVKSPVLRKKIADLVATNAPFLFQAPVCLVIACQETKYYLEDGSAATTQAILCAAALGLGSCWIAGDKKDYCQVILDLLKVPKGYKLVSLITLGVADKFSKSSKRNIVDMIHREEF